MNNHQNYRTAAITLPALLLGVLMVLAGSCKNENSGIRSVAVFVPGVVAGSPTYEMMVEGVNKAVNEQSGIRLKVIEGGFNQGEWQNQLMTLASSGEFGLIVSSNPAMPQICAAVAERVPQQKFLLLDGYLPGNPNIYTFRFNQIEQAYLSGYFAGLVSGSSMPNSKETLRAGIIAGQEFPDMMQAIRPGFEYGFIDALSEHNQAPRVDFRVVGNWFDTGKSADLAASIYDSGADIILTIAGGANMGVVSAAREKNGYVLWFDSAGYDIAPGIIIGSTYARMDKAAYQKALKALDGTLPYGAADTGNAAAGWVGFNSDHPEFINHVPADIVTGIQSRVDDFRNGKIEMPMPAIR